MLNTTYIAYKKFASSDINGTILGPSVLAAAMEALQGPSDAEQDSLIGKCSRYVGSMSEAYSTRRIFRTANHFLGIGSHSVLSDDEI